MKALTTWPACQPWSSRGAFSCRILPRYTKRTRYPGRCYRRRKSASLYRTDEMKEALLLL